MEQHLSPKPSMLVAEIEISYRSKIKASERPRITSSKDSSDIFRRHWNEDLLEIQESFQVLYLNRANRVLGIYEASRGGLQATVVDLKLILATALKLGASSLIVAHNHPSGNLQPSRADQDMTSKIRQGAALLDIQLLDHIILSVEGYYSFADEGLL